MPLRRDPPNQRDEAGQSRFAQRGQSHEERMPEDDSAQRFPGEGRTRQDARYDAQRSGQQDGYYGSGGSYGYGGGFEHRGEAGYQEPERRGSYGRGGEEFYETTGGFGHDVSGYGREGLGYPGPEEDRFGSRGARDAARKPEQHRDDPRTGYSQDSGYAQSGGARKEQTGQGSGYSSSREGSPSSQGQGGGSQRFYGSNSSGQAGRGRFYGRTPQGYTRSDQRIREDICDALSHGHIDPSEISVQVEAGVVTLEGFADSRAEKFHIEEVADAVLGVKDVDNRVRIRRAGEQGDQRVLSSEPKPVVEPDPTKRSVNPTKGASS